MLKGKISVIIPVYNTEKYLTDCLESILKIKNAEIEIIAVNDGSTDKSLQVLEDFAERDKRIKVYSKSNSGVSDTRNFGIGKSSGEWITFVDSDDMVDAEEFDDMLLKVNNDDLDMVFASFCYLDLSGKKEGRIQFINKYEDTAKDFIDNIESLDFLVQDMCSKLYRAKIIKENSIRFDSRVSIAEDGAFNMDYYRYVHSAQCIDKAVYMYRIRPGSLSNHVSMPSQGEGSYKHYLSFIEYMSENYNVSIDRYAHLSFFFINMGVMNKIAAAAIDKERDNNEIREVINNQYVQQAVSSLKAEGRYRKIVYKLIKNKSINKLVLLFKFKFFLLKNKKIYSFVKVKTSEQQAE